MAAEDGAQSYQSTKEFSCLTNILGQLQVDNSTGLTFLQDDNLHEEPAEDSRHAAVEPWWSVARRCSTTTQLDN